MQSTARELKSQVRLLSVIEQQAKIGHIKTYCLIALAIVAIIEALALVFLIPLKQVKPYFIPIAEKQGEFYYRMVPADKLEAYHLMEVTRVFLKNYVIDRHTIDNTTRAYRGRRLAAQSTPEVLAEIRREYEQISSNMPDVKRTIEIVRDIQLQPFLHQIEFNTTDTSPDGRSVKKSWVVNIAYTLAGFNAPMMELKSEDLADNPNALGLTVTSYSWTERKNATDSKASPNE